MPQPISTSRSLSSADLLHVLSAGRSASFLVGLSLVFGGCYQPMDPGENLLSSVTGGLIPVVTPRAAQLHTDTLSGEISLSRDFRLFDLGPAGRGENWVISPAETLFSQPPFVVALFDRDYNLLQRQYLTIGTSLGHILRRDTSNLIVGVMAPAGHHGAFRLTLRRQADQPVPVPRPALVWLNFAGAQNIRVHTRSGLSFGPFQGKLLGPAYSELTAEIKAAIIEAMREDYAEYQVTFRTSDEGPPPQQPHSTLHFGGRDTVLLGLADSVDEYNANPQQTAVIYVETFSEFSAMRLSPAELGLMIANVASHELGHLLGLYHTADTGDVMDTTGSAWNLAGPQSFRRARLEASVFATGWSNSPQRLEDAVGLNPAPPVRSKPQSAAQVLRNQWLRQFIQGQLGGRCGTCQHTSHAD